MDTGTFELHLLLDILQSHLFSEVELLHFHSSQHTTTTTTPTDATLTLVFRRTFALQ